MKIAPNCCGLLRRYCQRLSKLAVSFKLPIISPSNNQRPRPRIVHICVGLYVLTICKEFPAYLISENCMSKNREFVKNSWNYRPLHFYFYQRDGISWPSDKTMCLSISCLEGFPIVHKINLLNINIMHTKFVFISNI